MKDVDFESFNYREELRIDEHNLDIEWSTQPLLFMKYAEACASAKLELDKKKEKLEIKRATLDNRIREDPGSYTGSDKKPTEAQIANTIVTLAEYKEVSSELNTARHHFELMSAAVRAFEQRKSSLENLVRLYGQQYYSTPSEEGADAAVVSSIKSDRVNRSVRSHFKRFNSQED